jgi:zinc protease
LTEPTPDVDPQKIADPETRAPEPSQGEVNGWRLLTLPSRGSETAALASFIPAGAGSLDLPGLGGAADLALSLMQKGTKDKSAAEFAEAVEDLGSSLSGGASADYAKWGFAASTLGFEATLDLWAEAFNEADFQPDEVEKERDLQVASLRMAEDNKFSCAYKRFLKTLYAGTPYAEPSSGTLESVPNLERDHLVNRWEAMKNTRGGVIVAVGNFDEDKLVKRLGELLPTPYLDAPPSLEVNPPAPPEEPVIVEKDTEQAFLCMGAPTVPYAHEDYPALRVLGAVMGEGMGSRMFIRLRDQKGLAYDPGASVSPRRARCHSFFYIGPNGDRLDEARQGIDELIAELRDEPPTDAELNRAKNYIAGNFLFDHQKNSRRAHYFGFFEMMGAGFHRDREFPKLIEAITAEQVREVARKYLGKLLATKLTPTGIPTA